MSAPQENPTIDIEANQELPKASSNVVQDAAILTNQLNIIEKVNEDLKKAKEIIFGSTMQKEIVEDIAMKMTNAEDKVVELKSEISPEKFQQENDSEKNSKEEKGEKERFDRKLEHEKFVRQVNSSSDFF